MPMDKEAYENLLNELNSPDLEHSRRTEILQELRADYSNVHTDFSEFETKTAKLEKDNNDLIISNSKLFREVGIQQDEKLEEKEKEKSFSEEVTIESLEKQVSQ